MLELWEKTYFALNYGKRRKRMLEVRHKDEMTIGDLTICFEMKMLKRLFI